MNSQKPPERAFYDARHQLVSETVDWSSQVDELFVFTRRQRVAQYLCDIKLFERILGISGSIIECGVDRGGTLMLYFQLCSVLEPYGIGRKVYGFDTFDDTRPETLPANRNIDSHFEKKNQEASIFDTLHSAIRMHDLNRPASHLPKCELIRGNAKSTIPAFVESHPELLVALLHLDFGDYDGTKIALQHFLPLMPKGAVVAINTLNFEKWPGDNRAFKELIDLNKVRLERFPFNPWTSFYVVGE